MFSGICRVLSGKACRPGFSASRSRYTSPQEVLQELVGLAHAPPLGRRGGRARSLRERHFGGCVSAGVDRGENKRASCSVSQRRSSSSRSATGPGCTIKSCSRSMATRSTGDSSITPTMDAAGADWAAAMPLAERSGSATGSEFCRTCAAPGSPFLGTCAAGSSSSHQRSTIAPLVSVCSGARAARAAIYGPTS
jgi:hypothetical protein